MLSLDADYEISDEFINEIESLGPSDEVVGYRAGFVYRMNGRPLRGTLYPPRTVLYLRDAARYHNEGHGHRVSLDGPVGSLESKIFHDDRKPLSRWIASQKKYAEKEADYLLSRADEELTTTDKIRRMGFPAPFLVFFYAYFIKRCVLDGRAGIEYTLQRVFAEILIAVHVVRGKFARRFPRPQSKLHEE